MNVFTSSELASKTKMVCDVALQEGCAYITSNGKVNLALVDITAFETLEDAIGSIMSWRARSALERIWSEKTDHPPVSIGEINEEISMARSECTRN